jgi:hypothetical protein
MLCDTGIFWYDKSAARAVKTTLMNFFCLQRKAKNYDISITLGNLIKHFLVIRKSLIEPPSPNHDLYSILTYAPLFQSTDPRDLLFSKTGLLGSRYNFPIDYSASNTMSLILIQFAQRIIEVDKDLRILCYACMLNTENDRNGLPSWVPNWKRVIKYTNKPGFAFDRLRDEIKLQYWPVFL